MPYAWQTHKTPLPRNKDRRVKLTDLQRALIRQNPEGKSVHALAIEFGVSRRTIQFVQDPEKRAANYRLRVERGGSQQYYEREKNTAYMRGHRRYKQKTLKEAVTI